MTASDSPPFDALVFDLGNVIVAHDNAVMFERIGAHCAQPCSADQVIALVRRTDWGSGEPISKLHAELGYGLGWDAFVADWCCHFTLDRSMLAFVQGLARHNRVMIFSNTNQQHWEFLVAETGGALAEIEAYLSHEIRCSKPSVRAFQVVAEKAGIAPARSIFFDDVLENVEGAREAGFQAEVFENEAKLSALLRERGVRFA